VNFLLDHNLSPNLARALALLVEAQGDDVKCLKDFGRENNQDEEWIPWIASQGEWVIITADLNIVRNRARQLIFRKAGITAFFLLEAWSNGSVRGPAIAQRLLRLWDNITQLALKHPRGTCFAVPYRGAIRRFSPQGKKPI
jgi:hypothetical protein